MKPILSKNTATNVIIIEAGDDYSVPPERDQILILMISSIDIRYRYRYIYCWMRSWRRVYTG